MSAIGAVLRDRYEIITELGKGGMSTVYLAKDNNLDSYWAVKQVKNNTNIDIEAFKREVELLSSLSHSDIPRIVDRIEVNDDYFVIMDFIDGTSLGKKVLNEGPLIENHVVEWAKMLCDVLEYLHNAKENPIIYRDMKPDNVMLTQSGRIKLIDFGIAKECIRGKKQTGDNVGTRGFAAPEQYTGSSNLLDERTDIYSLGATLYFLVTAIVPGKPPKAFRPIRQINPFLSEGLEYIIAKCTDDEPDNRYQKCKELREDLENIQQLTSAYRRKMTRKLLSCGGSFLLGIICLIFVYVGYLGIEVEKESDYQAAFQKATSYDRQSDYMNAARYYVEAIKYKPDDYDTHLLLFNALLPRSAEDNYFDQTKSAIDEIRKGYIENDKSGMYHNSELMYQIVKRCIEVNDPVYAAYAVAYIDLIKESKEYEEASLRTDEIDSFEVIASNCSKNIATQDFAKFQQALLNLEKNTDGKTLSINEKLENYYTLMVMYSTYSGNLDNAYIQVSEVGMKAKEIIDTNLDSEELTFNNIIPMYELMASSLYNSAIANPDDTEKEEAFIESLKWFGYLEDLNDDLTETLELKRGNAYMGIFDIYNTYSDRSRINGTITGYLDRSIQVYKKVISANPSSFLAYVYLVQAYLDKEMVKPVASRNYDKVNDYFKVVVDLKNNTRNLSNIALLQFSSLKQQMQNAGLEGTE